MKICIEQKEDGTFSVYNESEQTEAAEGAMPEAPGETEQGAQTAKTVDEALAMAGQMLGAQQAAPADSLNAGFQRARGMPAGM